MNEQTKASNNTLPLPVIVLAMDGDIDAINAVLKHYEGYIAVLVDLSIKNRASLEPLKIA